MSDIDRRKFLGWTTLGGAAAIGAGCDAPPTSPLWPFTGFGRDGTAPFAPPSGAAIDPVTHALNRLTFGVRPGDYQMVSGISTNPDGVPDLEEKARVFVEEQLDPESIDDGESDAAAAAFESLWVEPIGELLHYNEDQVLDEMVRSTILRAVLSRRQLFEVMVSFWSDHFNIDPSKGDARWFKAVDDRAVVREHAMGRFSDLVRASALSPAMMWYLDGRVNQKESPDDRPNENYARELLELHTLGVHGGYSQEDVMEVARCLSGWTVRERDRHRINVGEIEFNSGYHDDGAKIVLGEPLPAGLGRGDLDRVLAIVTRHPSTADHIATKLCRRFIADDPPPAAVNSVSTAFLKNGGDIRGTLRALFSSPQFWEARGVKFKRPFHFIVSCLRAAGAETDVGPVVQDALQRMGHMPFHYPTPDGYPMEPEPWMASLLWRWRFALQLARGQVSGTSFDEDRLASAAGGVEGLARHMLGRRPTTSERSALGTVDEPFALLAASPPFQFF